MSQQSEQTFSDRRIVEMESLKGYLLGYTFCDTDFY